jgi:hypothetical protein
MIGLTLAVLVIGIALLFVLPWVGVPIAIIAGLLLLGFIVAFVRRSAEGRPSEKL